jgi:hypothetical protein
MELSASHRNRTQRAKPRRGWDACFAEVVGSTRSLVQSNSTDSKDFSGRELQAIKLTSLETESDWVAKSTWLHQVEPKKFKRQHPCATYFTPVNIPALSIKSE